MKLYETQSKINKQHNWETMGYVTSNKEANKIIEDDRKTSKDFDIHPKYRIIVWTR